MRTLFFLIILSFLSCGTDQGSCTHAKFTIKNETNKQIKILAYNKIYPSISPIMTTLNINEELTKTSKVCMGDVYSFREFFDSRDSLKVIYDTSKVQFFVSECGTNEKNPLSCDYYGFEGTFIFTEQDYENAEDCNGNCD
jgi:hypothetical protein